MGPETSDLLPIHSRTSLPKKMRLAPLRKLVSPGPHHADSRVAGCRELLARWKGAGRRSADIWKLRQVSGDSVHVWGNLNEPGFVGFGRTNFVVQLHVDHPFVIFGAYPQPEIVNPEPRILNPCTRTLFPLQQ